MPDSRRLQRQNGPLRTGSNEGKRRPFPGGQEDPSPSVGAQNHCARIVGARWRETYGLLWCGGEDSVHDYTGISYDRGHNGPNLLLILLHQLKGRRVASDRRRSRSPEGAMDIQRSLPKLRKPRGEQERLSPPNSSLVSLQHLPKLLRAIPDLGRIRNGHSKSYRLWIYPNAISNSVSDSTSFSLPHPVPYPEPHSSPYSIPFSAPHSHPYETSYSESKRPLQLQSHKFANPPSY
mmetsp:Transcript_6444/g.11866  ORF Transcript_6444/g.11866 Transcript_6444/m.11866 type:complete len:235 (-) Transcript_6444:1081-1785(-)